MTYKESSQLNLLHGIILLIGSVMLAIALTMVFCDTQPNEGNPGYIAVVLALMFSGFILIGYGFIFLCHPGIDTLFSVVIKRGCFGVNKITNIVEVVFDADRFYWRWDNPYHNYRLIRLSEMKFHELSPYIICGDRVRRISCCVEVSPPTEVVDCQVLLRKLGIEGSGGDCNIGGDPIRSLILDYCERDAESLKELFNPYSQEQQAKFKNLAEVWFALRLREFGLTLKNVSFSIAN